ncbi:hypothetical protein C0081_11890 [Cohaesibacter celericrescens]|uniref:Uncharacterized protein n=1 Tax=Cohaesibacter celericrescens TaxID=2067669 RepID=A0A2N5XQG5_9HYPH|nr:hypothetical protein C0081_11890 [Cohaesibacter celericrescens]
MLVDRRISIVAKTLLVAGTLSLFGLVPAAAFPKLALPNVIQQNLEPGKTQPRASANSHRDQNTSRSPLIMDIGARTQLFDGDFLCVSSDQRSNLFANSNQF